MYNNIYIRENLIESMKTGIIRVLYKKDNPSKLKNWRPISLLTLDYKILTKILASRLNSVLNKLLHPFQSSGVKDRNVLNNILNLDTIIQYIEENNLNAAFISLDNEKAFDRLEQNFMIKVLEKYNFPQEYITWIKIIYSNIKAKILVNGTFTESIDISRSVRQGCPLSMPLYILSLEPFIHKVTLNSDIKGLKIPNLKNELKILAHADDLNIMLNNDRSYLELKKETNNFGKISGSRINEDKTEILVRGNFEVIPQHLIKKSIKVLGCYFGENANIKNYMSRLQKMETTIKKWKFFRINLHQKILFLKTYIIGLIQYHIKAFELPNRYLRKMNILMFKYIWGSNYEKISRKALTRSIENGGMAMIDLKSRRIADIINQITNINNNLNQPWACLYIYWFGLSLRKIYPNLASNSYVHTLKLPTRYINIKQVIQQNIDDDKIWQMNNKNTYKYLIQKMDFKSKTEKLYPNLNWKAIWQAIFSFKNSEIFSTLYKYIFGVLPTGEYLVKFKILKKIPICVCENGFYTANHIVKKCDEFGNTRAFLEQDIQAINPHININETLYMFGNNQITDFNQDLQICKMIFEFVYHVWLHIKKPV